MLRATNIQKSYNNLVVLKGIDLTIEKGEITTIVGASGAGKSTLLHILGTLDKPDKGSVALRDVLLDKMKDEELAAFRNTHIGFIFQFHNLLPEFTALENICIPGFIAARPAAQVEKRAMQLMELLGIADRRNHRPSELSGGEQQRVSVARALINQPAIIFADEPSGNLDTKNAEELHQLFFTLRAEFRQTFVIVTHNTALAAMSDRTIELSDGRIKS